EAHDVADLLDLAQADIGDVPQLPDDGQIRSRFEVENKDSWAAHRPPPKQRRAEGEPPAPLLTSSSQRIWQAAGEEAGEWLRYRAASPRRPLACTRQRGSRPLASSSPPSAPEACRSRRPRAATRCAGPWAGSRPYPAGPTWRSTRCPS